MSLYTTPKGSHHIRSHYLVQSLNYLADHAGMTLFSLKNLNLGSSQTVLNPDGNPIADVVEITMRSSTIGSNTVDLQFFYDPYDWSFPPDLIIDGLHTRPSLKDLGLDSSWDHDDPANLSREMDCSLIPGIDGPTKVVFAVPFYVVYTADGKKRRTKVVAKIQFMISSLVPNDVTAVQSKIETLSPFSHPELIQSIIEIGKHEPIVSYIERVTKKITDHFEKDERAKRLRKDFIETITSTFRENLLECDIVNNTFASFLFSVPKDMSRPDVLSTAIATFYLSDRFPEEYPKLTLTSAILPSDSNARTPAPEVIPISRYSPRWNAERIVTEIWEQLWEEIPQYHAKVSQLAALN
ncbi:hypothetical protein BGZ80_004936 [Entomortierella chlamydospora]|uniref:BRISC and BRCA1-A complex member 2 n=1 Tax=Entomortierella chlamydospora TaxID=101097 RepID=A0A9P6MZU8_9FUNG|nr:hypothetical protein BGZ80_004936 [Entomortierella chlamydospora]